VERALRAMTGNLRAGQVGFARCYVNVLSWESLKNQRKNFFFEKKKQKTFVLLGDLTHVLPRPALKRKFFAAFFQKRGACFV
jgi:hypothetical protein